LIAVCGLCGGAGASTLAYLLARNLSESLAEPVLVCDTGGPGGGLAAYSRVGAAHSLSRIANAVAAHEPLAGGLFADDGSGLRVMASRPQLDTDVDEGGLARVLRDARAAHALTVVDCGTLATVVDRRVLDEATHAVWAIPASSRGVRLGFDVLALFGVREYRREVLVARHEAGDRKPPIEQLTALAEGRQAPLVLMPSVENLIERPVTDALQAAAVSLAAVQSVIER
jgi:hypothetical protein